MCFQQGLTRGIDGEAVVLATCPEDQITAGITGADSSHALVYPTHIPRSNSDACVSQLVRMGVNKAMDIYRTACEKHMTK